MDCQKERLLGQVNHVRNICHLELANPLTKCTLLVIGRSRMRLILQGIRVQVQVLKPCKFVQETSKEALDFKTRQLAQQIASVEVQKADLAQCSTATR